MRITENPEEIIIRHVPVRAFLVSGALALIVGVLFFGWLYSTFAGTSIPTKLLTGSWFEFFWIAVFGLVFLLMLLSFLRTPVVTVTVSHKTKSVEAHFRRVFGSETNRYYFTQINHFRSYKGIDSSTYYLGVILANNKEVQLKAAIGKDPKERTKFVKKLNQFIKPPKPSQKSQTGKRRSKNSEDTE